MPNYDYTRKLSFMLAILLAGCGGQAAKSPIASPATAKLPAKYLPPPPVVVFIGDSQTAAMFTPQVIAKHPTWINAGSPPDVVDETSGSVLARFAANVTLREPKPYIVVILVGVYDLTSSTVAWPEPCGPDPTDPTTAPAADLIATCANLIQMVEMAQAAGVKVIYGTLPPLGPGPLASELEAEALTDPLGNEALFNRALQYAQGVAPPWIGNQLVDYANDLPTGWTDDGVTPNALGAQEMAAAVEKAIEMWPRPLPD